MTTSSQAAKILSKLGAAKGGRARAKKLSPERMSEIARQAARARWGERNGDKSRPARKGAKT